MFTDKFTKQDLLDGKVMIQWDNFNGIKIVSLFAELLDKGKSLPNGSSKYYYINDGVYNCRDTNCKIRRVCRIEDLIHVNSNTNSFTKQDLLDSKVMIQWEQSKENEILRLFTELTKKDSGLPTGDSKYYYINDNGKYHCYHDNDGYRRVCRIEDLIHVNSNTNSFTKQDLSDGKVMIEWDIKYSAALIRLFTVLTKENTGLPTGSSKYYYINNGMYNCCDTKSNTRRVCRMEDLTNDLVINNNLNKEKTEVYESSTTIKVCRPISTIRQGQTIKGARVSGKASKVTIVCRPITNRTIVG